MKTKYVIFDFNGTILDDVDLCLNLLNEMLEMCHHAPCSKEKYKQIFTFPIIEYYKKAGFNFEVDSFEELASYFIKKYQPASYKCKLNDHLIELLDYLKSKNIGIICLSASERNNLIDQLEVFKIDHYFDAILGTGDIYAKSKLDIAKNYFEKEDINAKECLFIGDTLHDLEIANHLHAPCLLVDFGHQDRSLFEKEKANIISSFLEVEKYL